MLRAGRPSSPSPNRSCAACICLEPDADPRYAVLDATKYSSQRILDAEREIIMTARTRADWSIAPRPDERLGDDQALAVEALTAIPHQLTTVVGPAGAGKTTMLRSVAASYRAAGRAVCVLTLSAAAARVVTDETGIPATTIAGWQHGTVALPHRGLVLVDEASMVPTLTLHSSRRQRRPTDVASDSSATTPRWDHPKRAACCGISPSCRRPAG